VLLVFRDVGMIAEKFLEEELQTSTSSVSTPARCDEKCLNRLKPICERVFYYTGCSIESGDYKNNNN